MKKPTDAQWKAVKMLVDAGWRLVDIERRFKFVTAAQISAKKRQWSKEAYYTDPKYAKYHTPEYKSWRSACLKRDNYTCRWCKRSKLKNRRLILQVDHIKPQSVFPELRYIVSNGRTLCKRCHMKTSTWGRKALNYRKKEVK